MPMIEFNRLYRYAHNGIHIAEYYAGQIVNATNELAESALRDKVAKLKRTKAFSESSENRAFCGASEIN